MPDESKLYEALRSLLPNCDDGELMRVSNEVAAGSNFFMQAVQLRRGPYDIASLRVVLRTLEATDDPAVRHQLAVGDKLFEAAR